MATTTPTPTNLRALYRRLLRELPSLPSKPTRTPLQTHIRHSFASTSSPASPAPTPRSAFTTAALSDPSSASSSFAKDVMAGLDGKERGNGVGEMTKTAEEKFQEAEQLVLYLRAQRMYLTLVERYNPGMGMSEEEKLRLTARRVGMNLPVDYQKE